MDFEDESQSNDKAVKQFLIKLKESQKASESTSEKLSTNTILKFLTARKFNVQRAVDLYISHQETRRKENLLEIDPWNPHVRKELLSEKLTVLPTRDKDGSGILLFTARQHQPSLTNHSYVLQGLVIQLDAALESPETQKNGIVFIYDMTGSKFANFDYELNIKILKMLRGSYPARLKKVLIVTAPLWFKAPFKVLRVFILEKLRDRVHILSADELVTHLPLTSIPIQLGGYLSHNHQEWLTKCLLISTSQSSTSSLLSSSYYRHNNNNNNNNSNNNNSNSNNNNNRDIASYFRQSSLYDTDVNDDDECHDGDDDIEDDEDDDDDDVGFIGDHSKFTSSSSSSVHEGRKISPDSFFNDDDDDDVDDDVINEGADYDGMTKQRKSSIARKRSAEISGNKPTKKKLTASSSTNATAAKHFSTTTSSSTAVTSSKDDDLTVVNYDCSKNGLTAVELQKHFDAVGVHGLEAEYNIIRSDPVVGSIHKFKMKVNQGKNRYSDVVCLDRTRVPIQLRLSDDDDGDYIHANYVDGYNKKKTYICTQGPVPETYADFWQMVWEQKVMVVVMTTKLMERGRTKCGQYWPKDDSTIDTHNSLAVINCGSVTSGDLVTTTLLLQNVKTAESREIKHIHFLGWPDYGVPTSAESFLELMFYVRQVQATMWSKIRNDSVANNASTTTAKGKSSSSNSIINGCYGDGWNVAEPPIVVHCSAGIGRSGTYIAIDIMTQALKHSNKVNVMEVIRKIRSQRALSIQMSDQYAFCYKALLCYAKKVGLLR